VEKEQYTVQREPVGGEWITWSEAGKFIGNFENISLCEALGHY